MQIKRSIPLDLWRNTASHLFPHLARSLADVDGDDGLYQAKQFVGRDVGCKLRSRCTCGVPVVISATQVRVKTKQPTAGVCCSCERLPVLPLYSLMRLFVDSGNRSRTTMYCCDILSHVHGRIRMGLLFAVHMVHGKMFYALLRTYSSGGYSRRRDRRGYRDSTMVLQR